MGNTTDNINKLKEIKKEQSEILNKYGHDVTNASWSSYGKEFEDIIKNSGGIIIDEDELKKDLHLTRILNNCQNITDFNLDEAKFCKKAGEHGDYKFIYNKVEDKWKFYGVEDIDFNEWGISPTIVPEILVKTPQYTLIGSPIINNYIASGFSSKNYIQVPDFTPELKTWKMHIKFRTSDDVQTKQTIWYVWEGDTMGFIYDGYLNLVITGVTSWNTTEHRLPLEPNTLYDGEWVFDGSSYTLTLTKEDGTVLTTTATGASNISDQMFLGAKRGSEYFLGEIDLEYCWYEIESIREWEAYSSLQEKFITYGTPNITVNKGFNWSSNNYIKFNIPVYETVENAEVVIKADVGSVSNYPQLLSFQGSSNVNHVFGVLGSGYPAIYNGSGDISITADMRNKKLWFKNTFKDGQNVLSVLEDNGYTLDTLPEEGWLSSEPTIMLGVNGSFIAQNGEYILGNNYSPNGRSQYWNSSIYFQTLRFTINGEELTDVLFSNKPRTIADGDNFTISIHDESDGFEPYWNLDLNALLEEYNEVEVNGVRYINSPRWIILFNDNDDVKTFYTRDNTNSEPIAVVTSDGSIYKGAKGSANRNDHTWDKSKDIICEDGRHIRWAIQYYHRAWDAGSLQLNASSIYVQGTTSLTDLYYDEINFAPYFEGFNSYAPISAFNRWEAGTCFSFKHLSSRNPLKYDVASSSDRNPSIMVYGSKVFIPFVRKGAYNLGDLFQYAASKIARVSMLDSIDKSRNGIMTSETNIEKLEGILDLSDMNYTNMFYLFTQSRCLKSFKVILPKNVSRVLFGNGYQGYGVPDVDDESLVFLAKYAPEVNGAYLETPYAFRGRLFHCKELIPYKGQELTPLELLRAKGWNVDM